MVKEGPCCHCGIENTPLWRNGPASKPVLCNACGSRWRTRGTLNDYVPKHAMSGYSNPTTSLTSTDDANSAGPSEPNLGNVPRGRRSSRDQLVLSSVERLHKQLYDIMHQEPEVFMKDKVVDDVLINKVDNMMSTQPETALGAMLLNPPDPGESVSSSSMKMSDASSSADNGGNAGEATSTENGGNGGEQGESSFT